MNLNMKNYTYWMIIAALVVALLFSVQRCHYVSDNNVVNLNAITDSVRHYKNALGTQTASIKTLELDKNGLQDELLKKDAELAALTKEFANIHTVTKYQTITRLDTVTIAYKDSIPYLFERSGAINQSWYSFTYHSGQNGLTIANLALPNTVTVITGTKRKWFLGKETVTTDITNSNPNITVTQIKAAEYKIPVPWYKKWYVWLAAGSVGGFLINN